MRFLYEAYYTNILNMNFLDFYNAGAAHRRKNNLHDMGIFLSCGYAVCSVVRFCVLSAAMFAFASLAASARVREVVRTSEYVLYSATISEGMEYFNYKYFNLYGGAQNITAVEFDTRLYSFSISDFGGREKTSVKALESGAAAAINGSFFDKDGGSVTYLQIDGKMLDTTVRNNIYNLLDGAVMVRKGRLSIADWSPAIEKKYRKKAERAQERGKVACRQSLTSVIAAPPILVRKGKKTEPDMVKGLSTYQHPRSVIYTKGRMVGFMVIDGRSKGNATGMSMEQMQEFLINVVGADDAINLDGGGSSTLWVKSMAGRNSGNGFILNMPCDNRKFDSLGERKVGNGIFVFRKSGMIR